MRQLELQFYYVCEGLYDPTSGRFMSIDPIGFDGGDVNLYRYVGNNPVAYTDPTGLLCPGIKAFLGQDIANIWRAIFGIPDAHAPTVPQIISPEYPPSRVPIALPPDYQPPDQPVNPPPAPPWPGDIRKLGHIA